MARTESEIGAQGPAKLEYAAQTQKQERPCLKQGGSKKQLLTSCPLTSTYAAWYTCTYEQDHIYTHQGDSVLWTAQVRDLYQWLKLLNSSIATKPQFSLHLQKFLFVQILQYLREDSFAISTRFTHYCRLEICFKTPVIGSMKNE